jgi:phosphomannomutase
MLVSAVTAGPHGARRRRDRPRRHADARRQPPGPGALGAHAGVVVSASHNPFDDNGLKVFGPDGAKLDDEEEAELELHLDDAPETLPERTGVDLGRVERYRATRATTSASCSARRPTSTGCGSASTAPTAPRTSSRRGCSSRSGRGSTCSSPSPTGRTSTLPAAAPTPTRCASACWLQGLDVGVTFDGDADRALLVDRRGRLVTGDHVLAICAVVRGEKTVVATSMTNLGTERYLAERGITLQRVAVGDRYVLEALRSPGPAARRRAVGPRALPRQGPHRRRHPDGAAGAGRLPHLGPAARDLDGRDPRLPAGAGQRAGAGG